MGYADWNDQSDWTAEKIPTRLLAKAVWPSTVHPEDAALAREEVELFDLQHQWPARFYLTNRGVSRGYLDGKDPVDKVRQHIQMGYTNLTHLEQVAVAAGGELLRFWPARAASQVFVVLMPATEDQRMVDLTVSHPVRAAVSHLLNLSARMPQTPLLLARQLSSIGWH